MKGRPNSFPAVSEGEKYCSKCQQILPLMAEHFYRDAGRANGWNQYCKRCVSAYAATYREANPDKAREYARKDFQIHKVARMAKNVRWQESNRKRFLELKNKRSKTRWNMPDAKERRRVYREANREALLAREREQRKRRDPLKVKESKRLYNQTLRAEMLMAYGGHCACCGESEPAFLTLEHLNGDGAAHRKATGGPAGAWVDLRKRGWPKDGYTLLCWNCNCATRYGTPCPHVVALQKMVG